MYRIAILAYSNSGVGNYTLRIYPGTIQPLMHTLTGAKSGTGSGTVFTLEPGGVNCGSTCSQQTNDGRYVTWTAVADEGSKFIGWKDAPTCPGAVPCVLDTTGNRTVTAVFTDLLHKTLTVSKDGAGSGTVTSAPAGIDCGAACAHAFDTGTMVTLNPNPATGSDFTGWSGACSGTGTCQVTMDDEKSVTATYSLSVSPGKALTLKTGKAKLNWKKGTALLPVTVNQPAKIALTGRNVKKKTVTTKGPKTVKITVAVTGKPKKALKKKRKAVAKLTITAKPSSGATTVVKKTRVTLKLKKKKKRH